MRVFLLLLIGLPVLYGAGVFVASEYGGEVVTLRTADSIGQLHDTHLWVVDDEGRPYLRAGRGSSQWVERIRGVADVELVRNGSVTKYRAELAPDRTPRVDALMAEKYSFADWLISLMRDPEGSLAVRLMPPKRNW